MCQHSDDRPNNNTRTGATDTERQSERRNISGGCSPDPCRNLPRGDRRSVGAWLLWHRVRTPFPNRAITAIVAASTLIGLHSALLVGWPWRVTVAAVASAPSPYHWSALAHSALAEMSVGPTLALLASLSHSFWTRTLMGQAHLEHREMTRKARALQPDYRGSGGGGANRHLTGRAGDDPAGGIRLGVDQTSRPFDISPEEISQHIFIPGTAGFGKTTN